MAQTTIYIIDGTDGTQSFAIQPRTIDGSGGIQRTTDLTLYGNATPNWGERFNENFFRLLENFACEESPTNPGFPLNENDPGVSAGFGINNPIAGQMWYNKTDTRLYVFNGTLWSIVGEGISYGPTASRPPAPRSTGDLYFDTDIQQLLVYSNDGSPIAGWQSVAEQYVLKAGDTMTGKLIINGGSTVDLMELYSTSGPRVTLRNTSLATYPPMIRMYNRDNDPLDGGSGVFGWITLVPRDNVMFNIEGSDVDPESDTGTIILQVLQTGEMYFYGQGSGIYSGEIALPNSDQVYSGTPISAIAQQAATKGYVENAVASIVGDYVNVTGDTMTGELNITTTGSTTGELTITNTYKPTLKLRNTTLGSLTTGPSIELYNVNNTTSAYYGTGYPYTRITARSGNGFVVDIDRDDNNGAVGANTKTIMYFESETGVLYYNGITSVTPTNVIRTVNATISMIDGNSRNLTTKEYVQAEIASAVGGISNTYYRDAAAVLIGAGGTGYSTTVNYTSGPNGNVYVVCSISDIAASGPPLAATHFIQSDLVNVGGTTHNAYMRLDGDSGESVTNAATWSGTVSANSSHSIRVKTTVASGSINVIVAVSILTW